MSTVRPYWENDRCTDVADLLVETRTHPWRWRRSDRVLGSTRISSKFRVVIAPISMFRIRAVQTDSCQLERPAHGGGWSVSESHQVIVNSNAGVWGIHLRSYQARPTLA